MGQYVEIILGVLGVLLLVAGTIWVKWQKAKTLLKELSEALVRLSAAVEDDKISRAELDNLVNEFGDVLVAATKLFKKT